MLSYNKFIPSFYTLLTTVFFILCMPLETLAGNKMVIKNAELVVFEDEYFLNTNIDVKFSEELEQTLLKGFELYFILEFQLATPRKYWFDDEIVTITYPITLTYHPLSRQFLMTQAGTQKAFASLPDVLKEFANLRHIKVIKKSELEKSEPYKALLLLRLDSKKLPKTIQESDENPTTIEMKSQLFEWIPSQLK